VLGVYEWSGMKAIPPEIWVLPYCVPFHPGRMWCHSRLVYLPMSYLYGRRFVGPINATILSLRKELYTLPYHILHWDQAKTLCAKVYCLLINAYILHLNESEIKHKPKYYASISIA